MNGTDLPLYRRILGSQAELLPPVIARMHDVASVVRASGFGTIRHGENRLARVIAWLLRLPAAGDDRPLRVTFERCGDHEILSRRYPDATLTTRQSLGGPPGSGILAERFGPLDFRLRLRADSAGIAFELIDVTCLGLPLPRWARPRLEASEAADGEAYRFHVQVALPLVGRLIEYRGRLAIEEPNVATSNEPLVLFDGACSLCNWSVGFLAPRDRFERLRFASVQSAAGQEVSLHYGLPTANWDSFVFCEDGKAHLKADAFFRVLRHMRWPWPLLGVFRLLPRRFADFLYDRIARNRYRLFGRRDACLVPGEALRKKFLA